MTWALINVIVSLPGLALWRFLMTDLKPTFRRSLHIPGVITGTITADSDHRGLVN